MDILQQFNDIELYHVVHNIYRYIKHPIYLYEYIDFYNYYFANYKHNLLQNKYYINLNSYGCWKI